MDNFVKCVDCKCLRDKQCRRTSAEVDHKGYGMWPQMIRSTDGCFDGKIKAVKLSEMVAKRDEESTEDHY